MRRYGIRVAARTYGRHLDDLRPRQRTRCLELVAEELLTIEEDLELRKALAGLG